MLKKLDCGTRGKRVHIQISAQQAGEHDMNRNLCIVKQDTTTKELVHIWQIPPVKELSRLSMLEPGVCSIPRGCLAP